MVGATSRLWGVRAPRQVPREKIASPDEGYTSEEEQPVPTLDAKRLEILRHDLDFHGITPGPVLKTDCKPLAAILDGAIPSWTDCGPIHDYLKMRGFSIQAQVAVLACIQRRHPGFASGLDLTSIHAVQEQAEVGQLLSEAASQGLMVFDLIVNCLTPEIIRNKVAAVLSNPACRVRTFSWRGASFPEWELLPSVAKALRECVSIETVSCPSTWFGAIGDKVRNLEIWGWIE